MQQGKKFPQIRKAIQQEISVKIGLFELEFVLTKLKNSSHNGKTFTYRLFKPKTIGFRAN
jgi:hypothetical protein